MNQFVIEKSQLVEKSTNMGEEDPDTALTDASLLGWKPGWWADQILVVEPGKGHEFGWSETLPKDAGRIYTGDAGKIVVFND